MHSSIITAIAAVRLVSSPSSMSGPIAELALQFVFVLAVHGGHGVRRLVLLIQLSFSLFKFLFMINKIPIAAAYISLSV